MPTFDDLLTAVRDDSDHAVLATAEDLGRSVAVALWRIRARPRPRRCLSSQG
jgi:hypothetical protein